MTQKNWVGSFKRDGEESFTLTTTAPDKDTAMQNIIENAKGLSWVTGKYNISVRELKEKKSEPYRMSPEEKKAFNAHLDVIADAYEAAKKRRER